MDEKWRGLLSDFIPPIKETEKKLGPLTGGDITIVVSFAPWPLAWANWDSAFGQEREFRFEARNDTDGKFRWFSATIDRP